MVPLQELWLPILVAAALVFVASSVIHMVLPYHKSACGKLPNEDALLGALRAQPLRPGQYMFPRADSMKAACSPEMLKKYEQGPVGFMTVMPSGAMNIGKSLGQWFALTLAIGACTAYVAGLGLVPGADALLVFRFTSAVALVGYAFSSIDSSIWKGVPWSTTAWFVFDGVVYSLCTGAAFAWLWPAAAAASA